jgi:hypothetical protein
MLAAIRLQYSQSLPWVILLLAGLVLMVLLAYPAQLRQVPRRWRWLLPTLRILAVSALGLSILRPVVTRPRLTKERAPVVVLVDDSASMGVVDSNRPAAEWVGIAAALGKLPPEARDKRMDAVQSSCDRLSAQADDVLRARAGRDYARLSGRGIEAAQARLDQSIDELQTIARDAADASASMRISALDRTLAYLSHLPAGVDREAWLDRIRERARSAATYAEQARMVSDGELYRSDEKVREACRSLESLSRLQLAETMLLDADSGLVARLGADTSVLGYGISDHVVPFAVNDRRGDMEPLNAEGSVSNLTGGMRAVLESLSSAPPRAVVIFSDGRMNGGDTDAATMAAVTGVPVYAVGVAARAGVRDISITNAVVPSTATVGETIPLNVEVRGVGMRGVSTDVTVTGGGDAETRWIRFEDDQRISLSFNRKFTVVGLGQLTVEVAPVAGELSVQNNRVQRWVEVLPAGSKSAATTRPATQPAIEAEMADLTGDEGWLRRLAEASSGQFLRLDQVDLLPRRLGEMHEDANHPVEIPLWDGVYLYALVLGCLATEWGMRKRFGLA